MPHCERQGKNLIMLMFGLIVFSTGTATAAQVDVAVTPPSTALLVSAINQPHIVRADDGLDHVEYDLLFTNAFAGPVTLVAVDVIEPGGTILGRVDSAKLAAATQSILLQAPVAPIPPSGSAAVEIDLALKQGQVPRQLSHHVIYQTPGASAHLRAIIGSDTVSGPSLAVSSFRAITITPPLRGSGWAAFNGCCTPNAHRNVRVAAGTRIATAETFAIDFLRVDGDRFYTGDGKTNGQYPYFGAPVQAASNGTVVAIHDGMAETTPFGEPTTVTKPVDFGGNYVLIRQAAGVYAFYAHLRMGSVAVKIGEHVVAGAVLGGVGNSGNSTNPHLHFGLLDRPDFITGNSLPFVFADFTLTGHITDGRDDGTLVIQPDVRTVRGAYPLVGAVANYR